MRQFALISTFVRSKCKLEKALDARYYRRSVTMTSKFEPTSYEEKGVAPPEEASLEVPPLGDPQKGRWERSWPTIACGAGLFSDGYLNGVCVPTYSFLHATRAATMSHKTVAICRSMALTYILFR